VAAKHHRRQRHTAAVAPQHGGRQRYGVVHGGSECQEAAAYYGDYTEAVSIINLSL